MSKCLCPKCAGESRTRGLCENHYIILAGRMGWSVGANGSRWHIDAADLTPEQLEDLITYALDQAGCPIPVTERIAAEARAAVEEARE